MCINVAVLMHISSLLTKVGVAMISLSTVSHCQKFRPPLYNVTQSYTQNIVNIYTSETINNYKIKINYLRIFTIIRELSVCPRVTLIQ